MQSKDARNIIGIFLFIGAMMVLRVTIADFGGKGRPAVAASSRPTPKSCKMNQPCRVIRSTGGPRFLQDQDTVVEALRGDASALLDLARQRRAAFVNAGETVKVIDTDISLTHGIWYRVKVIEGLAKVPVWIDANAVEGM